jgi:hypothetical protein
MAGRRVAEWQVIVPVVSGVFATVPLSFRRRRGWDWRVWDLEEGVTAVIEQSFHAKRRMCAASVRRPVYGCHGDAAYELLKPGEHRLDVRGRL